MKFYWVVVCVVLNFINLSAAWVWPMGGYGNSFRDVAMHYQAQTHKESECQKGAQLECLYPESCPGSIIRNLDLNSTTLKLGNINSREKAGILPLLDALLRARYLKTLDLRDFSYFETSSTHRDKVLSTKNIVFAIIEMFSAARGGAYYDDFGDDMANVWIEINGRKLKVIKEDGSDVDRHSGVLRLSLDQAVAPQLVEFLKNEGEFCHQFDPRTIQDPGYYILAQNGVKVLPPSCLNPLSLNSGKLVITATASELSYFRDLRELKAKICDAAVQKNMGLTTQVNVFYNGEKIGDIQSYADKMETVLSPLKLVLVERVRLCMEAYADNRELRKAALEWDDFEKNRISLAALPLLDSEVISTETLLRYAKQYTEKLLQQDIVTITFLSEVFVLRLKDQE